MQKTNFPFVAIVHDDASTDGTAAIIREYAEKYPDIIKPIYETENQYSKQDGSLGRIMNAAIEATGAKYIAMCEGDDYWIDPLKLQKQVDFLESHPDYGMSCGRTLTRYGITHRILPFQFKETYSSFKELILKGNCIPTLTTIYRTNLYQKYIEEIKPYFQKWLMGDYPMWLYFSLKSKIKYFDNVFGIYRILKNSASHNTSLLKQIAFEKSYRNIKLYFNENFNSNNPTVRETIYYTYLKNLCKINSIRNSKDLKDFIKKYISCNLDKINFRQKLMIKIFSNSIGLLFLRIYFFIITRK